MPFGLGFAYLKMQHISHLVNIATSQDRKKPNGGLLREFSLFLGKLRLVKYFDNLAGQNTSWLALFTVYTHFFIQIMIFADCFKLKV